MKKAEEGTSTLDVILRHVLPVYVAPQSPGGPKLSLTITSQGDTPVYANNSIAHTLVGSWREWQVKLPEGMPPGKAVYKLTGLNQIYQLANHE